MIQHINAIERNNSTAHCQSLKNRFRPGEVNICIRNFGEARCFENIQIQPGIKMVIASHTGHNTFQMDYDIDNAPISFSFNLSQNIRSTMTSGANWKREIERSPGDTVVAYLPKTCGTKVISPINRIAGVALHFYPHAFFSLFKEQPECLKQLHPGSNDTRFYHHSRIKRQTLPVLRQIIECPYTGETRRLYLEAKALELVALKLAELDQGKTGRTKKALPPKDLDRIREAHHILMAHLDQPPSLYGLSRLVGVNRNKLNRGFKEIYGDTAFNILRDARLTKARTLMAQTDLSLSEIALSVGYNSQANFTTAFRKQFGTPPNTLRRNMARKTAQYRDTFF